MFNYNHISGYNPIYRVKGVAMKNQAEQIRSFILGNIPTHPKDIVSITAKKFSVSRTTVHRHLNKLAKDKKIIKTGMTVRASYFLFSSKNKKIETKIQPGVDEHEIWKENFQHDFSVLNENVSYICNYGFTEIFNNAIDHSEGSHVVVQIEWDEDAVTILVWDDGIGIFKKIKTTLGLEDEREAVLQLSKGKFTTEPKNHTGEGIFFTSRCFDEFWILANGLRYGKCNEPDDWFFERRKDKQEKGTYVSMQIKFDSKRRAEQVFNEYSNVDSTNSGIKRFDKTHILVTLSKLEEERYVSRSQAKRILVGLEKFREIILDFKDIKTVGQGFVDEIFRVFKNEHPETSIEYRNANEDVEFMIKRGIPT
jgi:DNA-binding Lrp family transcriptional regulator